MQPDSQKQAGAFQEDLRDPSTELHNPQECDIEYTRSSETFPKQGFGGWHEDRAFSGFPLLGAGFTFTCPLTGTVLDLYPELAEIEDVTGAETATTDDTEFVRGVSKLSLVDVNSERPPVPRRKAQPKQIIYTLFKPKR
jgi:hypothetical protein